MNVLRKFVNGLVGSRASRLCKAAGLTIEESDGDSTVVSFGGDRSTPRRLMFVADVDEQLMMFSAYVLGMLPADGLPDHLLLGLMTRGRWSGSWNASIQDSGGILLFVKYTALSKGLDAEICRDICLSMIGEVAEVETLLAARGLL